MKQDYSERLRDPRWRERRKKIIERDKGACRDCRRTEGIQVHHRYYAKGRNPWEYPDFALVTLCASCHSGKHDGAQSRFGEHGTEPWEMLTDALVGDISDESSFESEVGHLADLIADARRSGIGLQDIIRQLEKSL